MTNAADGDFDNVSAKTLTASSSTGGSSLDKSDRGSILADATYQPSIFIRVFVGDFNLTVSRPSESEHDCIDSLPSAAVGQLPNGKHHLFRHK